MMGKRKTTVYLDEELLRQMKIAAARSGKRDYEVMEAALRRYLGLEVVDRVREGAAPLAADEALELAYEELRAMRADSRVT